MPLGRQRPGETQPARMTEQNLLHALTQSADIDVFLGKAFHSKIQYA